MKKRLLLTFLAGLMLSWGGSAAAAQEALKSERDVKAFTGLVMATVARGDLGGAYAELKTRSSLPADEIDAGMNASIAQRNDAFFARYGKVVGYDFIRLTKRGKSLMRVSYVEQREKQPLVWTFDFYSSGNGWVLNQFKWDGSTDALFLVD